MKLEFFVSHVCIDSPPAIEIMAKTGLKAEPLNITGSIPYLKRFLEYRDAMAEFTPVKQEGYLGIPCLIVNEGAFVLFDFDSPEQVEEAVRAHLFGKGIDLHRVAGFESSKPDGKMRKDLGL